MANSEWQTMDVAIQTMGGSTVRDAINSFKDLRVWQEAMELAAECYRVSRKLPREETYGLTSQTRRAAASIAANIAEGLGRENRGSFIQFLRIAQGSLKELETHLLIADKVGLLTRSDLDLALARCESVGKMLRALIRSLQQTGADQP